MTLSDLKHRNDFGTLLNAMGLKGIGLEVGVAYGENARQILEKWGGSLLMLVDPWNRDKCGEYIDGSANIDFDGAYMHCIDRLKGYVGRTGILRMTSDEAVKKFTSPSGFPYAIFDFVYLDGNHHNPVFVRDLLKWERLVKDGGIISGHDYYDLDEPHYRCEVKKTVDAFVEATGYELHITGDSGDQSWWIHKPEHKGFLSKGELLKFLDSVGVSYESYMDMPETQKKEKENPNWHTAEKECFMVTDNHDAVREKESEGFKVHVDWSTAQYPFTDEEISQLATESPLDETDQGNIETKEEDIEK